MLHGRRDALAKGKSATGFFYGGKYSYVKNMRIKDGEEHKKYTLEFEGVYKKAEVYCNGVKVATCANGYIPFLVSLDGYLHVGDNEICVKADNSNQPESRWYSGAGIYRSVWLYVQDEIRIAPHGVKIDTISTSPATIRIQAKHFGGELRVTVKELAGLESIAESDGDTIILEIENAKLWDEHHPNLYEIEITLWNNDVLMDRYSTLYGIRTIEKRKDGLYINGERTLLKGGCIHHDNGILGACEYDESAERKIRILKENGFNAIRSAHNPCSESILRACDKYGVYIMDETWDMWYRKKNPYDYANEFMANYKNDIQAIVEKDYNHPSVIMYSIGNEVSEPAETKGIALAKEMVDLFHQLDANRLVTAGFNLMIISNAAKGKQMYKDEGGLDESQDKDTSKMNSTLFNMIASAVGSGMNKSANGKKADAVISPVLDLLDISGYNYASGRYKEDLQLHPERLIIGSETFPQTIAKNWCMVETMPNIIGDFMWTAWDYLGEAGLGAWSYEQDAKGFNKPYPWLLADTGAFDILGNPNGEALLAKTIWKEDCVPEIAVIPCNHPKEKLIKAAWRGTNAIPSWNWIGCEGNWATVEVYAKGKYVELFLNDRKISKKRIKDNRAIFKVKYQSGNIKAVCYKKDGTVCGEKIMTSGIGKTRLCIRNKQETVAPNEVVYLDFEMQSENGIYSPNSNCNIKIELENGTLLGIGSANPKTEERYTEYECNTYYGRAQAVIKAGKTGTMNVRIRTNDETILQTIQVK